MESRPDRGTSTPPPKRRRVWQYATAVLAIVVISLVVLFVLFVAPLGSQEVTAIDWHVVGSTSSLYSIVSGTFVPSPSHCAGSTSNVCSDLRVAFNWSTTDGRVMSFAFQGVGLVGVGLGFVTIYNSTNQSWGGYSFLCGDGPRYCGDPFEIMTNDTTGYSWSFDWQIIYNYTSPAPLL